MVRLGRKQRDAPQSQPSAEIVCTSIRDARPRAQVCVIGKVTRMTARPTTGEPALCVSISDDTGTVTAVWTGRREIGGITLGRRIAIDGVPVKRADHLEFTNPGYTLLPR